MCVYVLWHLGSCFLVCLINCASTSSKKCVGGTDLVRHEAHLNKLGSGDYETPLQNNFLVFPQLADWQSCLFLDFLFACFFHCLLEVGGAECTLFCFRGFFALNIHAFTQTLVHSFWNCMNSACLVHITVHIIWFLGLYWA